MWRVWGREEACPGFCGETWGKETTGETQAQLDYIKLDLQEVGCGGME